MDIYSNLTQIFESNVNLHGALSRWGEDGKTVDDKFADFMENEMKENRIKDFQIEVSSFDCGPASEPAACFVAWVTLGGKLEVATFEWYD